MSMIISLGLIAALINLADHRQATSIILIKRHDSYLWWMEDQVDFKDTVQFWIFLAR